MNNTTEYKGSIKRGWLKAGNGIQLGIDLQQEVLVQQRGGASDPTILSVENRRDERETGIDKNQTKIANEYTNLIL